jgi:hypothetical protein
MKAGIRILHLPFITNPRLVKKFRTSILIFLVSGQLFSQVPAISSFTPASAATGTTVTITGNNFTGTTVVSFGGTAASSFIVVSATSITAVVAGGTSGSVSVIKSGTTVSKAGFYYLPLSGIITDFSGYWPSTTASNNATYPDDNNNLLAFTYNGVTYSTGVNDGTLTGQGITYSSGRFKALPVANIAGVNVGNSIYLAMASKVDGNPTVANASAVSNLTVKDVLTDGINGLNMGTGFTNLPTSAIMTFDIHIINPEKILDAEPDILLTQIASPSSGNDIFQFVNSAGVTVGNVITQDMTTVSKLGTYYLDLFNLSPGITFNSAKGFSAFDNNTTRDIRVVGFKLSDFGISNVNYTDIAALKITPSGTSDYAFIAFNANAIEMAPNISQNIEQSNSSICSGGSANLEVIASAAYGGSLTYDWQQSTNGGSSWTTVSNGGSFSGASTKRLTITSAHDAYKYKATVTESGTGFSSYADVFTIAVIAPTTPTSVSISAPASTTCLNNLVSLSSTISGGSNLFYQWQSNASGAYVNITGANLNNYIPPVNSTGNISYQIIVSSGSGCLGRTSSAKTINVVGISSVTPASRCGTGVVSLSAAATSGNISWYSASSEGTLLHTGTTYTPTISATTNYYLATDIGTCSTAGRVPIVAIINTITWAGTNTTEWSTLANWDCGGVPTALPTSTNDITIPAAPTGGKFPTISSLATINNIVVSPGASITVADGGTFEIYGTINNNGTFNATNGTIAMRGTAQQTIAANTFNSNTIKNLIINNSSGVLLGGSLNITGTYTPTAGTLTTFGYLTLKSTINGTARVASGSGIYISGNVNVERYMPARRSWRMLTSPLTNSNTIYQSWQNGGVYTPGKGMLVTGPSPSSINGLDPSILNNVSLKLYNNNTQQFVSIVNTKIAVSSGVNGSADNTGYFVFVRGDRDPNNIDPNAIIKNITTITSTGYLQTGTQHFTNLSATAGGFSIIGNPYASPIDLNGIISNSGTSNIKRKFYVWDPMLNQVGGYVALDDVVTPGVFLPSPAVSTQGNDIQSGQAFFAVTNTAGSAAVEIKEINKSTINNTVIFGRPAGSTESLIANLYLLNTADGSTIAADGIRADYNPAFSADIDDLDNLKCTNSNETFGILRNNIFLATERRPTIFNKDTLFLKLTQTSKRNYQFKFIPSNFADAALTATLEDSYTKLPVLLNLFDTTRFNFVINTDVASQATNRFRIIFGKSSILAVQFLSLKAYPNNKNIIVEWKVENELNIKKYEVERSTDGSSFTMLNSVNARGNNLAALNYNYIDSGTEARDVFYRVKSIALDGSVQYSQVVKVSSEKSKAKFSVYPNPITSNTIHLKFLNQPAGLYTVQISNNTGQLVFEKAIDHKGGNNTKNIELLPSVKSGNFQLTITDKELVVTSIKIFIQ